MNWLQRLVAYFRLCPTCNKVECKPMGEMDSHYPLHKPEDCNDAYCLWHGGM